MPKVTNEMRIQDINTALVAHEKQSNGEKLNRREKQAVNNFADLYVDIAEEEITPALRNTLRNVLKDSEYGSVKENALLTKHLAGLRERGCATDAEVCQIKKFAAKVSENEDNAISATLAELTLNNGVSDSAIKDIKSYLDTERSNRTSAQRNRAMVGAGIAATAVVGGALAGPLILWIPAVTAALAAATETAAAAVSLGALLGGAAAGGAAGKVANKTLNKSAKNYGVNE